MSLVDTVKNVFVPLFVNGRRWGNFELAYRDDAVSAEFAAA